MVRRAYQGSERTYRIEAKNFVAGFIVRGHHVAEAAPIIHWLVGREIQAVTIIARRLGWRMEMVCSDGVLPLPRP